MSELGSALRALAALDPVDEAVTRARNACTELRWHNALRKRMPECRAEATVRAARSSSALEGARYPIAYVREVIGAGREVPDDMSGTQLSAAVRVAAVAQEYSEKPDALRGGTAHILSKLSLAAGAGLVPEEQLGRPRLTGEVPGDLGGLPPAPGPEELVDRLGQLDAALFRARRLVADTGLHAMRWTRQQAIDYGIPPSEVDRYVVMPGQATSYMIGQLEIVRLRDKARDALGERFDPREFHNRVLLTGVVPLELLEREVDDFIAKASVAS